jgi:apolipoprotein N-acyltransferase
MAASGQPVASPRRRVGLAALRTGAALLSGAMFACAFPLTRLASSLESVSAAWLFAIPLLLLAFRTSPRGAFWWGWLSGFTGWLLSLWWLLRLNRTWGNLPVTILAWAALAAYCALYTAIFSGMVAALSARLRGWAGRAPLDLDDDDDAAADAAAADASAPGHPQGGVVGGLLLMLLAAIFWAGLEYIRGVLFSGFPWNGLGISQAPNLPIAQLASLGGVQLVSAFLIFVAAGLAITLDRIARRVYCPARCRTRFHVELSLALLVASTGWIGGGKLLRRASHAEQSATGVVRVGLVQPNIRQSSKWSDEEGDALATVLRNQTELVALTQPDLVVWPETAIPWLLRHDAGASLFVEQASQGLPLLLGVLDAEDPSGSSGLYNAAMLIEDGTRMTGLYRKRHLVPFGEVLPLENLIPVLKRFAPLGFSCLAGTAPDLIAVPHRHGTNQLRTATGVLICFEDAFPAMARQSVAAGAAWLLNLTNDGWFEASNASRQHLAHSVFRAIENRRPVVRCANSGVSGFIDPTGRIRRTIEDVKTGETELVGYQSGNLRIRLVGDQAVSTPYHRMGDWLVGRPAALLVVLFLLVGWWRRRDSHCALACTPKETKHD